jgi:8-oxo-dGTP pyrophosphatase MutT (NUDIX family)
MRSTGSDSKSGAKSRPRGAWAIIYCPSRRSLLFGKRSMQVNSPGLWNLFGGRLEPGEVAHKGLLRELREEAGLTPPRNRLIHCGRITGADIRSQKYTGALRELDFFLLIAGYELELTLNHEHSTYRWFKHDKLPRNVNPPTAVAMQIGMIQKALEACQ